MARGAEGLPAAERLRLCDLAGAGVRALVIVLGGGGGTTTGQEAGGVGNGAMCGWGRGPGGRQESGRKTTKDREKAAKRRVGFIRTGAPTRAVVARLLAPRHPPTCTPVRRKTARAVTKKGAQRPGTNGRTHHQSLPSAFKCGIVVHQVLNNSFPMCVLDPET